MGGIGRDQSAAIDRDIAGTTAGAVAQRNTCRGGNRSAADREHAFSKSPNAEIDLVRYQRAVRHNDSATAQYADHVIGDDKLPPVNGYAAGTGRAELTNLQIGIQPYSAAIDSQRTG